MSCNDRCHLPDQLSTWFHMTPFRVDWSNNGKVPPNSTELQGCLTSGSTFACFRWVSLPSFTFNFEIQVFLGEPQSGRSFLSFLNCLKSNEDQWNDSRKKKAELRNWAATESDNNRIPFAREKKNLWLITEFQFSWPRWTTRPSGMQGSRIDHAEH